MFQSGENIFLIIPESDEQSRVEVPWLGLPKKELFNYMRSLSRDSRDLRRVVCVQVNYLFWYSMPHPAGPPLAGLYFWLPEGRPHRSPELIVYYNRPYTEIGSIYTCENALCDFRSCSGPLEFSREAISIDILIDSGLYTTVFVFSASMAFIRASKPFEYILINLIIRDFIPLLLDSSTELLEIYRIIQFNS